MRTAKYMAERENTAAETGHLWEGAGMLYYACSWLHATDQLTYLHKHVIELAEHQLPQWRACNMQQGTNQQQQSSNRKQPTQGRPLAAR
jgi:hypothetical protein